MLETYFTAFKASIHSYELPELFTFPFYYQPHPLCVLAAEELQSHIENQAQWEHNFGLSDDKKNPIGKMFGVLLVRDKQDQIGYLAAFSGKLAGKNYLANFVPPVFDVLDQNGFFVRGQAEVNKINDHIELLENNPKILQLQLILNTEVELSTAQIKAHREKIIKGRKNRKAQRLYAQNNLSNAEYLQLKDKLSRESIKEKLLLRDLNIYWSERIEQAKQNLNLLTKEISLLKNQRKNLSANLQNKIFEQYSFLNQYGVTKSLYEIFKETSQKAPPAGAGECAAPKLLQYAFKNKMQPLAMAEFWWGAAPKSEIRKHKNFYFACQGKCQPILAHMLEDIKMDKNPLLSSQAMDKAIEVIYEDSHLLVINKPVDLLSVPGSQVEDSVYSRIKQQYPSATGPLIVHRLDMSTSGLMLIALSKGDHKNLQRQFIKRTIKKRYIALLDGVLDGDKGMIDLPLRVDLDDRPRQLVCHEHGKAARTLWEVISIKNKQTLVYFYPVTGRTHQLRVHSAHAKGLNSPISGDDLYGNKAHRLHLQAEYIEFNHPMTDERIHFQVDAEFNI